ncbi:MAG: GEVED domain-containing protein [Bacteroidales bacterium]
MKYIPLVAAILIFLLPQLLPAQNITQRVHMVSENNLFPGTPYSSDFDPSFDKPASLESKSLCVPQYSVGCGDGDGFVSFAVEQIQNYSSGCANLNGSGWSQYLNLGPAFFLPGETYDFFMQTGYSNQYTTIWIDFNDDLLLTDDEKILSNFIMQQSGQLYIVPVTIPLDALPGQHILRARTRWSSSCDDPCTSYQYGEAEDYYIIIGIPAFGYLTGIVTKVDGGLPVENASIVVSGDFNYSVLTGSDGSYSIDNIMIGDYTVVCNKEGYNIQTAGIMIAEDSTTIQHFQLTQPEILVAPLSIDKVLSPGSTDSSTISIWNNGNGPLDFSASFQILNGKTKDFMDLQFQYPVGVGGGEAGVETDGNYIYTTKWNGSEFYKYSMDGIYLESFTISGVSAIRDLTYDGTHFFGGAATPQVFELDLDNQLLIGSFMAPAACRAIAYNADLEVFYANNWSSPVVIFDKTGTNLGTFNVGPAGGNYYGFACDLASMGGPFLWGYAQTGTSQNHIFQMQLPSGTETGYMLDLATKLTGPFYNGAGGLFTHAHIVTGTWTLGGLVQNQWIWGLELTDASTWLSVSPSTGTIQGGSFQEVGVVLDATELEPGIYNAEIYITTFPNIGTPVIDVTLNVMTGAPPPPDNFSSTAFCETLTLCWNVAYADSCSIYNYGTWVANTNEYCYTVAGPGQYSITVTAWFGGLESSPSSAVAFEIPWPDDPEPVGLMAEVLIDNIVWLSWSEPDGCAIPDGYNIYRNGSKLNDNIITALSYTDTDTLNAAEVYEYFTTAVYYFGESEPSNVVTVLVISVEKEGIHKLNIYPNPAIGYFYVISSDVVRELELINHSGFSVLSGNFNDTSIKVGVASLPAGIYLLKMTTDSEIIVRKILIR